MTDSDQRMPEVVIAKEKAVFWLDGQGYWRNAGGRFRKKKIVDYFHRAISRDEDGYFVRQDKGGVMEKVYFPYEDTALFVFDLWFDNGSAGLLLNTGQQISLDPSQLYVKDDNLYLDRGADRVKFTVRAMMKLSQYFEEDDNGGLWLRIAGDRWQIPEKSG
ncbi:MAG: MFS transporter permease [Thermodesulfobacteriota bacterium]